MSIIETFSFLLFCLSFFYGGKSGILRGLFRGFDALFFGKFSVVSNIRNIILTGYRKLIDINDQNLNHRSL